MRVAVCQVNSRHDRAANLAAAQELLVQAAGAGADLAVLPEYVDYLGPVETQPKPEPVDGEFADAFAAAAARLRMWVLAGSFHEVGPDPDRTYNTSLLFGRDGALAATYRKIHLFDIDIPGRVAHQESTTTAPGGSIVTADVDGVRPAVS
jgi:predicted amidohydrolase